MQPGPEEKCNLLFTFFLQSIVKRNEPHKFFGTSSLLRTQVGLDRWEEAVACHTELTYLIANDGPRERGRHTRTDKRREFAEG